MPIRLPRITRPRGVPVTGALLAFALLLACVVALQAHRAARAHEAAVGRLLREHTAYAAAEFGRRVAATLDAGLVTTQHFPTVQVDKRPSTSPLPPPSEFRAAIHSQDYWCQCFDRTEGFFRLDVADGRLRMAGGALDPATERWVREQVMAQVARLERTSRDMDVFAVAEGRRGSNSYQLRIKQTTGLLRGDARRTQGLFFSVVYDETDRARAAYGMVDDAATFAAPVFQRVWSRVPLFPSTIMRGLPNDSAIRVTVLGPGGAELFRTGPAGRAAATVTEPIPGEITGLTVRAELMPSAAARLVEGGMPASPLPLLFGLLAALAGVIGVAFAQMRRQHELARLRADFVSGVSHELRTPLTQIRMFSELLLGGRLRTDEERDRSLRLIDREARRLAFLVENVLDFSRGERGTLHLAPEPARVAASAQEIVDGFAPLAHARGMHLRTSHDGRAGAMLDRGAFRQILLNFLENAVKYGPAGQTITVRTERRGSVVRVSVDDGGPGIPKADRERVWEPYCRLDREIDRVVGGSGIGLSVVRDLVARHGGRAWVDDGPGGGARFVAEFPAARVDEDDDVLHAQDDARMMEEAVR